jgi:acetyltransferase-like isoleucine patch superfamily enzyme
VTIGIKYGSPVAPVIEDHVVIGAKAVILGDIRIGHHAVIGAATVVIKDVPPYAVVVGNPAKIIRYLKFNS